MKFNATNKKITLAETASFCSQMAAILHSGISALEGISIFMEDAQSTEEQKLLTVIYDELLKTGNLHDGLAASGVFPDYLVNMVKLGEQTGNLDDIMASLAEYYEREDNIRTAIHNAVAYPVIMIFMMLAVVLIIITKVLPVFNQAFSQLGAQMNTASTLLMNFGKVLNRYSIVLTIILAGIACFVLFCIQTEKGRHIILALIQKLPITTTTQYQTSLCRFCDAMSLALQSGFSTEQSLEMASELVESRKFEAQLSTCVSLMESGTDLSAALVQAKIFTGLQSRMIGIGAKTGAVESVFKKIAADSVDALESRLSGKIAIIEPTLVAVLSVITGIILLSVMVPLLGILSGM